MANEWFGKNLPIYVRKYLHSSNWHDSLVTDNSVGGTQTHNLSHVITIALRMPKGTVFVVDMYALV
jgi:hypothetical protein